MEKPPDFSIGHCEGAQRLKQSPIAAGRDCFAAFFDSAALRSECDSH
jgi:hypothetical protein